MLFLILLCILGSRFSLPAALTFGVGKRVKLPVEDWQTFPRISQLLFTNSVKYEYKQALERRHNHERVRHERVRGERGKSREEPAKPEHHGERDSCAETGSNDVRIALRNLNNLAHDQTEECDIYGDDEKDWSEETDKKC